MARRINWREGDAYNVSLFNPIDSPFRYSFATHELYHVLGHRWGIGSSEYANENRVVQRLFEELTADLYSSCGNLLAENKLSKYYNSRNNTATINGANVNIPLKGADLAIVLDSALSGNQDNPELRSLLSEVIADQFFANAEDITFDSEEEKRFISLCRNALPNPMFIESWLREIAQRQAQGFE